MIFNDYSLVITNVISSFFEDVNNKNYRMVFLIDNFLIDRN